MLVSILIPCYNEKNTIEKLIIKVKKQKKIKKQIILIDDGSSDGTSKIIIWFLIILFTMDVSLLHF